MKTHVLTADEVRLVIRRHGADSFMDALIQRLAAACREYDPGRTQVPARAGFAYSLPAQGLLEWMPLLQHGNCVLLKTVGYHPDNPQLRSLPSVVSVMCRFDLASGHLLSLTDGTLLTAMRTGAASAVASQVLAWPDARALGLLGCGTQAVTQMHALSRVLPLEEVLVFDRCPTAAATFARRVAAVNSRGTRVVQVGVEELLSRADVLCTATSVAPGAGPVFTDSGCRPWLHINAVGSDFPGKIELPPSLLRRSLVCPDFLPQALREGECQQLSRDEVGPALVELVRFADRFKQHREHLTVFDSTGWALEDLVALELLLDLAQAMGIGSWLAIECLAADAKDPYDFLS
jgi:ornithine cyclodeaminase/alanine dehydrogenase-like protein (mu-crystallin family)